MLNGHEPPPDPHVVTESQLRFKLNSMTDLEWRRYILVGLPSRLQ